MNETLEPIELVRDFQDGDFLYGLEKTRDKFRDKLISKITHLRNTTAPEKLHKPILITIDDVHKCVDPHVFLNDEYDIPLSPLGSAVKARIGKLLEEGNPFHPETTKLTDFTFDSPTDRKLSGSCKQALLEHNYKIRFCLDRLDLDKVRDVTHRNYNSFTSQELRFCAYNWELVKDRVVFYENGRRVDAPWSKYPTPGNWIRDYDEVELRPRTPLSERKMNKRASNSPFVSTNTWLKSPISSSTPLSASKYSTPKRPTQLIEEENASPNKIAKKLNY